MMLVVKEVDMDRVIKNTLGVGFGLCVALASANVLAESHSHAPGDAGVVNEQQILYWMVKRGELAKDATEAEKRAALKGYLSKVGTAKAKPALLEVQAEKARLAKLDNKSLLQRVSAKASDAEVTKTVKVLGVLIDFPDLPYNNNRLTANDTGMYYDDYNVAHYKDLLFSKTGFAGPQGQNLISGYQYFQEASGQTFFFEGDVKGWYRAANNAAYYGGNDPESNDSDKAVPELVKEAVTQAVADMSAEELASYDVEDPYDLNNNGNLNEPDGIIDHVMLFHSSIGEEAGGGVLGNNGADAIWSHRYFVDQNTNGYTIPGSGKKVFGYTVQPIDAAAGVCVHEFGHDLGLPDEYDTGPEKGDGSPVGNWSLMSGGSWVGRIPGSQPSGFSPYAASYLQNKYKGNWISEQEVKLEDVTNNATDFVLKAAVDHSGVNQLSVPLPSASLAFKQPYQGKYQYYSGQGNLLNHAMSFDLVLPEADVLILKMKAHWDIEVDYDYMQLLVEGVALAGNHTKLSNRVNNARNIITGKSSTIPGAEGENSWVDLEYDLSAYKGRTVSVAINYVTDQYAGGYGIAIDQIQLLQASEVIYSDDAETADKAALNGYIRTDSTRPGEKRRYIVQLRNHQGIDAGLGGRGYDPGVLIWMEDFNNSDNNVSEHPGKNLIGVIDADQNLIGTSGTSVQIRDAAFSLNGQSAYPNDTNLAAIAKFDDSLDYSAPEKPQAGMILPKLGITMEVVELAPDATSATIRINRASGDNPPEPQPDPLATTISASVELNRVTFSANTTGGDASYTYAWSFGDGQTSADAAPVHTYQAAGTYTVNLTVTDGAGAQASASTQVSVVLPVNGGFTVATDGLTVSFTNTTSGGSGQFTYSWNFGDGNSSSLASPSHTYAQAGTYTVAMVATDTQNNRSTISQTVTVTAPTTPTTPTTPPSGDSGGSGGGSVGWLTMLILAGLGIRRRC